MAGQYGYILLGRHLVIIILQLEYLINWLELELNLFIQEDIVKLQILNLATKLSITNPKQTRLLCQYVFNLAKYDQNYDIRDRARFLRQLIMPSANASTAEDKASATSGALTKHVKKIFLATKPAPVLESKFKGLCHLCVSFNNITTPAMGTTLG